MISRHEPMMPAKFLKVQVVSVINPAERVFMQLAKVIGFTKGVVGKLPVQRSFYGGLTNADLCIHAIAGKLFRQRSQKLINIKLGIGIGMYPKESVGFNRWECNQPCAGLIDGSKMIVVGNRQQLAAVGVAPVVEWTGKNAFGPPFFLGHFHRSVPASVQKSAKLTVFIPSGQYRHAKIL